MQGAYEYLLSYLDWTTNAVRVLGTQIGTADLEHLVLTKRYEQLLSGIGVMTGIEVEAQRVVNGLVSLEVQQRSAVFEAAVKALDGQIKRWTGYTHFVVPDTSFFIKHEDKLEEADFGPILDVWQAPITLLVPIVVVDELDKLKESKDPDTRWRAGYTLAVLDRVCAGIGGRGQLRAGESVVPPLGEKGSSPIAIELVFDPPEHERLSIDDDEIIDRALSIEPLAGVEVTLLTYDTGQSMRGRVAGLKVVKLSKPLGDELKEDRSSSHRGSTRIRRSRQQPAPRIDNTDLPSGDQL